MTKMIISRPSGTEEVNLTAEEELQRTEDVNNHIAFKQAQADGVCPGTHSVNGNGSTDSLIWIY